MLIEGSNNLGFDLFRDREVPSWRIKFYVHQEVPRRDQKEPHGENKRNLMVTMRYLTVRPRGSLMVGDM